MGAGNKQKPTSFIENLDPLPVELMARLQRLCYHQASSQNVVYVSYYIMRELDKQKIPYKIDGYGNIIAIPKSEKPVPVVVSHIDTVHSWSSDFKVLKGLTNTGRTRLYALDGKKPHGIGADDKCGVFLSLEALRLGAGAVFFTGEESGCIGSNGIELDVFKNASYILQFDRWGRADLVTSIAGTEIASKEFRHAILPYTELYGFKEADGMMTDVDALSDREVGVSCLNISCGYYLHHTPDEYIDTNELYNSYLLMVDILQNVRDKYPHITETYNYARSWNTKMSDWENHYKYGKKGKARHYELCDFCGVLAPNLKQFEGMELCESCYKYYNDSNYYDDAATDQYLNDYIDVIDDWMNECGIVPQTTLELSAAIQNEFPDLTEYEAIYLADVCFVPF